MLDDALPPFPLSGSVDPPENSSEFYKGQKLDDGWPESVEEQGLLLLVWRRNIRNDI